MQNVRLSKEDRNELTAFLNNVFSLHNGRKYECEKALPRVFADNSESMQWNMACKENRNIIGVAGNYPMVYKIGQAELKVGAIENVAVSPDCRGKGIMQSILNQLFEEEDLKGYDMYHLLGDRWRYRNFGFERCGSVYCFDFTRSMLGKEPSGQHFEYVELDADSIYLSQAFSIYNSQKAYAEIKQEDFYTAMLSHSHIPYVVIDDKKEAVAFFCTDEAGTSLSSLSLKDRALFVDVLKGYIDKKGFSKIYSSFPEYHELFDSAYSYAERYHTRQPGSFRIMNFKKVTETLLKEKSRYEYLPDGRITLDSEVLGKWIIEKNQDKIEVNHFGGEAEYILPGFSVYTFLFGIKAPRAASEKDFLLKSWFPLPLFCPEFH